MTTNNSSNVIYISSTSFTPTLTGSTTAGVTTYNSQVGYYSRVGNFVFVTGTIDISAATGTGGALIGGFPIAISNTSGYRVSGPVTISASGWTWSPSTNSIFGVSNIVSATTLNILTLGSTSSGSAVLTMTNAPAIFQFSFFYEITA